MKKASGDLEPADVDDPWLQTLELTFNEFYARSNAPEFNDVFYTLFRLYKRRLLLRYFLAALQERAEDNPPDSPGQRVQVLDIGAGDASELDYILCELSDQWTNTSRFEGLEFRLIEGYRPMLEQARERFASLARRGHPLQFETMLRDLTRPLPVDGQSQDIVVCSEVIEHLEDPEALLREVFRVLREGGYFLFTTDNEPTDFGRTKRFLKKLVGRYEPGDRERFLEHGIKSIAHRIEEDGETIEIYGHINTRTTGEWEGLLHNMGFEVVERGPYDAVVRHWGRATPFKLLVYAATNWMVSILPRRLGGRLCATTALLLRKP